MTAGRALKVGIKNAVGLKGVRQVKILAGPARGVRMTLDFSGHTPMYLGMFEWELHRFFSDALRDSNLVFDVGGYVGYDALMFAANAPGEVVTFEPNAEQAAILRANVAQNPELERRITVNPNAIGDEDGEGVVSVDSLARSVGLPDFIKIDIDGGEADALAGAAEVLRGHHPHVVVETHSHDLERRCGRILVDCGYRPVIKHNRRIWREERGGAAHNRWLLCRGTPGALAV